jgi:ferric-dicitrate binding protein FerR (iron transport regulator)
MKRENDRIARLIASYLLGEPSADEERALRQWTDASEENRLLFRRLVSGSEFERAYRLYQCVDWRGPFRRFERESGHRRRVMARVTRYAAALLLPLAAWIGHEIYSRPTGDVPAGEIRPGHSHAVLSRSTGEEYVLDTTRAGSVKLPAHIRLAAAEGEIVYADVPAGDAVENRLTTPRGGEYRLTLADGTYVHLNACSALTYPETFPGDKREVYLSGEAWFEVAPDAGRPFLVITDEARVRVYGTRFNVNTSREGIVQAALASGSIGLTFKNREGETLLHAGQLAEYHASDSSLTLRETDLLPYTGWKDNLFVFSGEPLGIIMERLSNWYDFSVAYADEEVAATRFSGYMKKYDDISIILEAIEKTAGVTFKITGKTIVVAAAPRWNERETGGATNAPRD